MEAVYLYIHRHLSALHAIRNWIFFPHAKYICNKADSLASVLAALSPVKFSLVSKS